LLLRYVMKMRLRRLSLHLTFITASVDWSLIKHTLTPTTAQKKQLACYTPQAVFLLNKENYD
jgi:hypothetical protein